MKKLKEFRIENAKNELEKSEMKNIIGAKELTNIQCGSFEVTCIQNCEDQEWVHYTDGVETWRTKAILTSDCNTN